jgi:energy-coupling factor transport system ATP-binding protein
MAVAAPLLEIEGFTFRYRRASEPAIRDVSLSVGRGEVLLVAGPSGCGKTTLIRAINGLIPHAYPGELGGTVRIDGQPTTEMKLRDIALTVGTVLQDPAKQIVGASVTAELAFGPENLGVERAEIQRRVDEVADRTGIAHLLERETSALSGGERQLLAVGGILMMRPTLFVVDEPLANLDPASAGHLLAILRELADEGHSVVIVEHRVEEALELRPDRVLEMTEGRATYLGPVAGYLKVADLGAVKLPFPVILERTRALAKRGKLPDASAAPGAAAVEPKVPDAELDGGSEVPRLEFRGLWAGYRKDEEVLAGVDARLGAREIVAVLGPNGSGKTTLFKTAMRLLEPTLGSVLVDGTSVRAFTVAQLATIFGYVFQSPSQMLFARTVREEITFGPRNLGRDPATFDRLLSDSLRRVSLDALEAIEERPPLALSFGQQKRLALAIALALEPRTLILDEPSAGQDHRTAERFMSEFTALPGLESLYFVTHDVDLALTHADRILLFRDGQVVADGPPAQVIEDEDRWIACNLRQTTLMRANLEWRDPAHGFLDGESLARWIVARERSRRGRSPGVATRRTASRRTKGGPPIEAS